MANYGFKNKQTALRLRDGAHKLRSKETIEYSEPGIYLPLFKFTLTGALAQGAGATADAFIELVSDNMTGPDGETATITDVAGYHGPLQTSAVGLCYQQLGVYCILTASCPSDSSAG